MGIFLRISIIFVFICNIDARPISYSGGHTLMHFNDSMKESIYYHYSPIYKFSIGLESMQNKVFSTNETNIRFTYLLNRKNKKLSQRNFIFSQLFLQKIAIMLMVFTEIGKLDDILLDLTTRKLKT